MVGLQAVYKTIELITKKAAQIRIQPLKSNKSQCSFLFEKVYFVKEFPQYKCKSMCFITIICYTILLIICIVHTLNKVSTVCF